MNEHSLESKKRRARHQKVATYRENEDGRADHGQAAHDGGYESIQGVKGDRHGALKRLPLAVRPVRA